MLIAPSDHWALFTCINLLHPINIYRYHVNYKARVTVKRKMWHAHPVGKRTSLQRGLEDPVPSERGRALGGGTSTRGPLRTTEDWFLGRGWGAGEKLVPGAKGLSSVVALGECAALSKLLEHGVERCLF